MPSCQIALFSSKNATESFKPFSIFCFDLQFFVKTILQVSDSTSYTYRDKDKRPKVYSKQKDVQNSLPCFGYCVLGWHISKC